MESFIVSARKYRPQTFETVVGQASITNTLRNAIINKHLAQAFLFCGPRGVGKTTCARILAKTINCANLNENVVACDQCESCTSFNKSASFNIHELDAASNNSVDDIRNLVDQVRIPPQVGKYKVYIIDEVHMLSTAAFNAFLKTLEEPPDYAKFILATTEKHKIIPTILSRCQIYDFRRITIEDIAKHLAFVADNEGVEAEVDALHIIAQKSDGALRDALSIFDQIVSFSGKNITYKNVIENLNVLDYDYYFRIVDAIVEGNITETLLIINEIIDNGFEGQHFIIGFGEHLRNLLVCKDPDTIKLLEVGGMIRNKYQDQSARFSIEFLLKSLDINNKCDIDYKSTNNKKLHLELALMQMCMLGSVASVRKVVQNIQTTSNVHEQKQPSYTPPKIEPLKQPEKPAEKKVVKTTMPDLGTISIKGNKTEKKDSKEEVEEDLSIKPADEFSTEQLMNSWSSISALFKTEMNFYSTLTKRSPEKKDNNLLEITVDNKVQQKEVEDRKMEFLPALREQLNNFHIQLIVLVAEQVTSDRPYTPQDKFNQMAEKNPALKKLKDQLDLEIDF